MLTAYLDHLQHSSATVQIASTLLAALAIGLGPFSIAALIDQVRVARRISQGTR